MGYTNAISLDGGWKALKNPASPSNSETLPAKINSTKLIPTIRLPR